MQSQAYLTRDAAGLFELWSAGLRAVAASTLITSARIASLARQPLDAYRHIRLLAFGKAGLPMAGAAQHALGPALHSGLCIVPHGYVATPLPAAEATPTTPVSICEARHPVPDAAGESAARHALELARATAPGDLLLVLISGGGTALLPMFAPGIGLDDARATFQLLLRSGASIHEMNCVRKHISLLSGGRLAAAARGEVLALAVSDVPGDDLSVIASGPTVADPHTAADALEVLARYALLAELPPSVLEHLQRAQHDPTLESIKPGDPRLALTRTELLATNRDALEAIHAAAEQRFGLRTEVRPALPLQAPADSARPLLQIAGGEVGLTVTGNGFGGRNQHSALEGVLRLARAGHAATLLCAGSDGVDGVAPPGAAPVAGAWCNEDTLRAAAAAGLAAPAYLANCDSYGFFSQLAALAPGAGGHIISGPTHINIMDIHLALHGSLPPQ